ncbi:polysaccharide deacetylase family protein [Candidatus Micrarchaeota archaeon]|nr:polysaccharide deacetylase family protein [Candidatus Micrarchaeota archaeon]
MSKRGGYLIISLDFEMHWGVHDSLGMEKYGSSILAERKVIPRLLELFKKYNIHATWATVGFLFFNNKQELMASLPKILPQYLDKSISTYKLLNQLGQDEQSDPYHYAHSVIKLISKYPGQEIASHTFSHYYCQEPGQDLSSFEADMRAALSTAKKKGFHIDTLIFPRNQYNAQYVELLKSLGVTSFRGNEPQWFHQPISYRSDNFLRRIFRFLDCYINISGATNRYSLEKVVKSFPYNLAASRFLRPYSKNLSFFEPIKMKRVLNEMTDAAVKGQVYHLWWHPHNFGDSMEENFKNLTLILDHYLKMKEEYGMLSLNMHEIANMLAGDSYGQ